MPILKNLRHERFAQELAGGKAACHAYQAAGYRPSRSAAARLYAKADVGARVRELQGEAAKVACLDRSFVLSRLMANVERSMRGEPVRGAKGEPTGAHKYRGHAVNRGLELLGKELGMFVERTENVSTVREISDEPLSDEAWAAMLATTHCGALRAGSRENGSDFRGGRPCTQITASIARVREEALTAGEEQAGRAV